MKKTNLLSREILQWVNPQGTPCMYIIIRVCMYVRIYVYMFACICVCVYRLLQ